MAVELKPTARSCGSLADHAARLADPDSRLAAEAALSTLVIFS